MRNCRTLLIYCVSFIGCFLASIAIDLACGGEVDPYDYYVSFFQHNQQGEKGYKPFYFTSYQFLYDNNEPVSEAMVNAKEWSAYLGKDVVAIDVNHAMYHLSKHADSILVFRHLKTGEKLPDSLTNNTFLKSLQLRKNTQALKYYRFAKDAEHLANTTFDLWNPKPIDTLGLRNYGNLALKIALKEQDKFIRLRYFYQAQRLLHYGHGYKEALAVYDKYIAPYPSDSHVKGWALALKAGELRRLKDNVHAAYLFSKVFAQYPEKRVMAYQNYHYINIKPAQVLVLATTNSEKAVICAINGFNDPDFKLEYLQKVYQYDPTSPMVGVLLVREVNKLEERYLTPKLIKKSKIIASGYYPEDNGRSAELLDHLTKLKAFCKQIVTDHKYPDYNIGNLAAAYLAWMNGDFASGSTYLNAVDTEKLTVAMADQKQVIQLLLTAQNIQKLNEVNESELLPSLKWLDSKVKLEEKEKRDSDYEFHDDKQFTQTARNFYQYILAPAYLQQGDTTRAAVALSKITGEYAMTDFWQNNLHAAQIIRIIRWKKFPPTVPYLNFFTDNLNLFSLNQLYDLLGTAYLREHQYGRAINAFKEVDPTYLNKTPDDYFKGDPFIDRINDYPKVLRYGKTKGMNRLQFAEAMNTIEQKIQSDPQNQASYYYRFATGLYNTSHYGNSNYLISYNWTSADYGRPAKYSYDGDYVRTTGAEKYYLKARALSNNEDFKAKCTIMAAKCRQKQFIAPDYISESYLSAERHYLMQLRSNDYFDELRTKYKKTEIFKKAVNECSYLKDYMLIKR